jgi:DNA-binding NtrC family response regulator
MGEIEIAYDEVVPSDAAISWSGPAPTAALAARLASAGVTLSASPGAAVLEVMATTGHNRPPRPAGPAHAWIWLPARPPGAAAISEAIAAGAYDVLAASAPPEAVAARIAARVAELRVAPSPVLAAPNIVAESAPARAFLAELSQAARTSMPVLLTGETGTGKEVAARLLHQWSSRRPKAFIPVNCAAIPNDLLESELFGYARGAFSGAVQSYDGQLSAAEGGTVFLDEVDDTPLSFQLKLLRVLEDRTVSRLGENRWRKVDFRILAATNRDLEPLIARGMFGADLYARLAIVALRVPPLRERLEDLPGLTRHMIARFYEEEPGARGRHQVADVSPEAMAMLAAHRWPGNIRELRNVVFGALVRKRAGEVLLASDLRAPMVQRHAPIAGTGVLGDRASTGSAGVDPVAIAAAVAAGGFNLRAAVETLERAAVTEATLRTSGNASAAAALLGEVGRGGAQDPGATVRAMMRRLGIMPSRRRARRPPP